MFPTDLKYEPLAQTEQSLCANLIYATMLSPDVMSDVDSRHAEGTRCAVIAVVEGKDIVESYVADEASLCEIIPLPEVTDAVQSYDMAKALCFVMIRDGMVAVNIAGRV